MVGQISGRITIRSKAYKVVCLEQGYSSEVLYQAARHQESRQFHDILHLVQGDQLKMAVFSLYLVQCTPVTVKKMGA